MEKYNENALTISNYIHKLADLTDSGKIRWTKDKKVQLEGITRYISDTDTYSIILTHEVNTHYNSINYISICESDMIVKDTGYVRSDTESLNIALNRLYESINKVLAIDRQEDIIFLLETILSKYDEETEKE